MAESGYEAFDKTLKTTHLWLNEIAEQIGPDKQRAYHALRAVLFALRDRITIEEAFHLSAQLPMLVRGIFWESYRPIDKPERYRSKDEFLERVAQEIHVADPPAPQDCARAVFAVLERHVRTGEVEHVKQRLPGPVQELFAAE